MATWNSRSAFTPRSLLVLAALALAGCSGGGSGGGSVEPPPPPPPLDRARFQVTLGGPGNDTPSFVAATPSGGALIVGTSDSFGTAGTDVWLVETDEVGTILRQRTMGSAWPAEAASAAATADGELVVGVATHPTPNGTTYELVRLDADWVERWRRPTGLPVVRFANDGDLLVASAASTDSTPASPMLTRLATDGSERWERSLDEWSTTSPSALAEGPDGDLYVSGGDQITRLGGDDGDPRWTARIQHAPPSFPEQLPPAVTGLVVRDDGSLVGAGYVAEIFHDVTYTPIFVTVASDGSDARADVPAGAASAPIVAAAADPSGGVTLLGSGAILHASYAGEVLSSTALPFAATAFAPAPTGRFVVGIATDVGRGQDDVLLAKLDAQDQLGLPPAAPPLPAATTFGAREAIADDLASSALRILATADRSSPPLVAWSTNLAGNERAAIQSARRSVHGEWEALELAAEGSGGEPLALVAAGDGRALAIWSTNPMYGALSGGDLDPSSGWNPSHTLLGPNLVPIVSTASPSIAANSDGRAVALWQQWAFGTGVLAARAFEPGTRSWSPAVALPETAEDATLDGAVAIDDRGRATVVKMGPHELRSYVADAGGSWQNLGTFAEDQDPLRSVAVVTGGGADVLVTWTAYDETGTGLRTVWLRDGRALAPVVTLDGFPTLTATPIPTVVDSSGHALVVWVDRYAIHASEGEPGGSWTEAVAHPDEAALGAVLAGASSLGHGDFLVSWFEQRGARGTAWASRYHLGGTWGPAEYLGDALPESIRQAGSTVVWAEPSASRLTLVARTAK